MDGGGNKEDVGRTDGRREVNDEVWIWVGNGILTAHSPMTPMIW